MFKLSAWGDDLTLEFLQMLRDGFATIRGVRVLFSPKIAPKIMELPLTGEEFSDTLDPVLARAQFTVHTNPWLQID